MTHRCNLQTTGTTDFNSPWFHFFLLSSFLACRFISFPVHYLSAGSDQKLTASAFGVLPAGLHFSVSDSSLSLSCSLPATFPIKRRRALSFRIAAPDVSRLRVGRGDLAELVFSLCTTCTHFRSVTPLRAAL